jgi:hypothetical protein
MRVPCLNIQMGLGRIEIRPGPDCRAMRLQKAKDTEIYRNVVVGLVIDE